MVVDGDRASRDTLSDVLRESGYLAFGVSSAADAFGYLRMGLRPCAIVVNLDDGGAMRFRAQQVADRRMAAIPVIVGGRLSAEPRPTGPGSVAHDEWLTRLLVMLREYCSGRRQSARAHLRAVRQPS